MIRTSTLIFVLYLSLISCDQTANKTNYSAEIENLEIKREAKENVDSIVNGITREILYDTLGLDSAPVKILAAKIVERDYSNFKDISLTFKNVSDKRIEAIRFRWYGENAFGEPADMGGLSVISGSEGFGSGFDDDPLGPGKTRTSVWNITSRNAKKVIKAWPYEVVFSDGSKWKTLKK